MSEHPTSLPRILAPLERTKGSSFMPQKTIFRRVVHRLARSSKKVLPKALIAWEDITRLARNEWIC